MDNKTRMQALIERHGALHPTTNHPDNAKLLPRVALQVATEFRSASTRNGYGYEVATAEDIYQRMVLKMMEEGTTADDLDHPKAEGKVRIFARHAALREVESAKANVRSPQGGRVVNLSSFSLPEDGEGLDADAVLSLEAHESAPTTLGIPEDAVLRADLHSRLQALVEDIVSKVSGKAAEALVLWVDGSDAKAIAKALGTSYGQARNYLNAAKRDLHEEEWESLAGVRAYWAPEAKRPKTTGAKPTALMDLVR